MNDAKKVLQVLSTLKTAIDENNVKKWAAKASSKRYKQEIEKLNTQMDTIVKVDNKMIEQRIKELTLQRETLEKVAKTLEESLPINRDSLTLLKVHEECVNDKLKTRKEQCSKLLNNHMQKYEKSREKLANTNRTYKILEEKRAHLKRVQFNIKNFENELKEIEWRKNYKFSIRQKLFYDDYISLAKAWLDKRNYDEVVKKIEENGNTVKTLLKEHMELNVKIKEKKKINMNKKRVQNNQASNNKGIALQKLMFSASSSSKIGKFTVPVQREFPKTPAYFPNHDLAQQNNSYAPPKPSPSFNTSIVENKQSCIISKPFEKIKILEDKLISVTKKDTVVKGVDTMTKEEKSKAVQVKMQKFVENVRARRSLQNCGKSSQSFHVEKSAEVPDHKNEAEGENKMIPPPPQPLNEMTQHYQPESGASQALENLNILSQDANIVNMFSQESGKNVQTNLKTFMYDFEKQTETFDNSSQGKINSSIKDTKTNVGESLASKLNETSGQINFLDKLSGARNEMNLKNQQFNDFNEKTANKTPIKAIPSNCFKTPNHGKFGRSATGPKTAIQENNNFNVQNEKNSTTNNIQKSIENPNLQMIIPFSMRPSPKTASQENRFNVQNEKNDPTNNVNEYPPFGNNAQKSTKNQIFQINMPFSMGAGTNGYKTQADPCAFDQTVTFKKPKLDNRQESNKPDLEKQGSPRIQQNIGSQNFDNMTNPNDIQYNFGNITQFMDHSMTELGDLNASYDLVSPDFNLDQSQNPGMGLAFSGTDFTFGQPTDGLTFNFN